MWARSANKRASTVENRHIDRNVRVAESLFHNAKGLSRHSVTER
jgi:hypothetical protein